MKLWSALANWVLMVVTLGTVATHAVAGGLILYETGTADVGLASSGYGARAQDASTVLTNPAGMTRLDGRELTIGIQPLYGDVRFTIGEGTDTASLGTGDGGNPVGLFPGGSLFYSHSASPALKLGVGVYGNFGLGLEYDQDWVGRYYAGKATLIGLSIQPTVAYRLNEKWSVGAGLVAMYGVYENRVAVNNRPFGVLPNLPDGRLEMDDNAWGFGANLGVLFELAPKETRLGLTWSSPISLDFAATAEFSDLAPETQAVLENRGLLGARVDLGLKVPQGVMLGLFHQATDRLAVLGNAGWQHWSDFGRVNIGINSTDPTELTVDAEYDDTWHVGAGAQIKATTPLLVNIGFAYDSGFQDGDNVPPSLPANSGLRFGGGVQFAATENVDVGFGLTYAYGGDLGANAQGPVRGALAGTYKNAATIIPAINLSSRF